MAEEKKFTEIESLHIISEMIQKAKNEFYETGISALLWGSVVSFCSLYTFINYAYIKLPLVDYIWLLTLVAIIPQIFITIKENKKRKFKSHVDTAIGGIWISYAAAIFLLSFYCSKFQYSEHSNSLFIILYGVPTFATGFTMRFKPMIIGGIACWVLALISMYVSFPVSMLLGAVAAIVAWLIPGLILRRTYLKCKSKNV